MKIRSYLVALVGSIFVPFTIFAGAMAYKLTEDERAASVNGLRSTTRALAVAIDRNVADFSNSLKVLATAELLQVGEFEGLHRFARRVVAERAELQRLLLARADGHILFDTDLPYSPNISQLIMARGFERAIQTGNPVIGPDFFSDEAIGIHAIPVFVPARVDGDVRYVLIAYLKADVISTIFRDQKVPLDWTGVVLNSDAKILGRSRSPEVYVGEPAPDDLTSAVLAKEEGIARYQTQEGWPMLAAFARSHKTGWTVVLGMPASLADSAAGKTLTVLIATGVIVSLIALALAASLGRQISRSVLGLLSPALAVGRGEPIRSPPKSGIAEIQRILEKLAEASDVLAERELRRKQAEDHLARAQRVAAIGSWELVLTSDAFHWSDETFRIFGVSRSTYVPTLAALSEIVMEEDLAKLRRPINLALEGTRPHPSDLSLDLRIRCRDGAIRILRQEGELVVDDHGRIVALIGTVQDVTRGRAAEAKRRELEQQLRQTQKMEALGQLTGGIAHDFNNLLAVIIGNLEMAVERQRRGEPATELDEASLRAAARGAALTRQLLAFARRQPLRPAFHDLRQLVEGMVPMLERVLTAKIALAFKAPDLSCWAQIDSTQFETALLNLVINARDAMPDGGTLTISIGRSGGGGAQDAQAVGSGNDFVDVVVTDSGVGMPKDTMARAFEPFFTTKAFGKGSGLGLSMVYGFVRQSGGRVGLESEPGKGTSVRLSFKAAAPQANKIEARNATPIHFNAIRILLVEDEEDVRNTVRAMLGELGATVITAGDGQRALEILASDRDIEAMLADIVMPGGMDGVALAENARILRPGLRIAFMSGHADLDHQTMVAINDRPFLVKPFRKLELAAALELLLSSDSTASELMNCA